MAAERRSGRYLEIISTGVRLEAKGGICHQEVLGWSLL